MDINWAEVLIGFLLGLTPLVGRQIYTSIKFYRTSRRKFLGTFWIYHRSTTGDGSMKERQINARYSLLFGKLLVQTAPMSGDPADPTLSYMGNISRREGMVRYLTLNDPSSHEIITWYVIDPLFDPFDRTVGIYLALDLSGLPTSGPLIMSRTRMQLGEADTIIESHVLKVAPLPHS
ncbi:hypothetical protein [Nocardia noduli]|uniref:hypothetical protein n=1 Tax=Nocardia noduli TaxID=2815722 RepID=UPI001C2141BD|nr:hypothetical protein [Nocardia noduli]